MTRESENYNLRTAEAVSEAVGEGAEYRRIQTGHHVSAAWASTYADLLERFPEQVWFHQDTGDPTFVNVTVTDPGNENTCVVQILFEAERLAGERSHHQVMGALFLYGNITIAQGLKHLFDERLHALPVMTADDVRALGHNVLVFAYGASMNPERMRERAPSAVPFGRGTLRGWQVRYDAPSPLHADAVVGRLDPSPDGTVEGVVYELSPDDKRRLDRFHSAGGYKPRWVSTEMAGGRRNCVAYERDARATELMSVSHLDDVLIGAEYFGLDEVVRLVMALRAQERRPGIPGLDRL